MRQRCNGSDCEFDPSAAGIVRPVDGGDRDVVSVPVGRLALVRGPFSRRSAFFQPDARDTLRCGGAGIHRRRENGDFQLLEFERFAGRDTTSRPVTGGLGGWLTL
ncbi:MAG TPA: hypothetical protein VKB86_15190 [Pyrinomonadaceae bacterium]|nr:hypothetical protein [Pyrinomonadaceae bacterium]